MVRITIDIGPSRRIGGAEAIGIGMLIPFALDFALSHFGGAPAEPPAEVPQPSPLVDWLFRHLLTVPQGVPGGAKPTRLAAFMDELMAELRPGERDILKRRFTGARPDAAPRTEPAPPDPPTGV